MFESVLIFSSIFTCPLFGFEGTESQSLLNRAGFFCIISVNLLIRSRITLIVRIINQTADNSLKIAVNSDVLWLEKEQSVLITVKQPPQISS